MSRPPSRAAATTARNALKTWAADQAAYEAENSTARPHQSPHSRSAKSNTVPIAKSNTVPFAISNTVSEARRFQLALDSETDVVKSGVRKGMLKGKAIRRVLRNAGLVSRDRASPILLSTDASLERICIQGSYPIL